MSNDVVAYSGSAVAPYVGSDDALNVPALGRDGSRQIAITDQDEFAIDQFSRLAVGHGLNRDGAKAAAREYYTGLMREERRQDEQHRKEARAQMSREWGSAYSTNVKRIRAFVDSLPISVQDVLWDARTADNVLALNDPSVLRWLLRLSQPAGSYQGGGSVDELKEIEHIMRTDRRRYNRDVGMQQRYLELVSMRDGVPKY